MLYLSKVKVANPKQIPRDNELRLLSRKESKGRPPALLKQASALLEKCPEKNVQAWDSKVRGLKKLVALHVAVFQRKSLQKPNKAEGAEHSSCSTPKSNSTTPRIMGLTGEESPGGALTVTAETAAFWLRRWFLNGQSFLRLLWHCWPLVPTKVLVRTPVPAVVKALPTLAPGPVVPKRSNCPLVPTGLNKVRLVFFVLVLSVFSFFQSTHSVQRTLVCKVTYLTTSPAQSCSTAATLSRG